MVKVNDRLSRERVSIDDILSMLELIPTPIHWYSTSCILI